MTGNLRRGQAFATFISERLSALDMTQATLAKKVEIGPSTVSEWIGGNVERPR